MRRSLPILESVRALYPKSANQTIMVRAAWRSEDSMLERPAANGSDGWTPVGKPATGEVILNLKDQGFTWVNLEAGGVAEMLKDEPISRLL